MGGVEVFVDWFVGQHLCQNPAKRLLTLNQAVRSLIPVFGLFILWNVDVFICSYLLWFLVESSFDSLNYRLVG